MASSLNKVSLLGNLGKDPEIRSFGNGGRVANLSVATSESWKDKSSGEFKERTEWHKVAIFNEHLVASVERNLTKGSKVYLEGKLQTRKYTDQSGAERYTTEVVLQGFDCKLLTIDGKPKGQDSGYGGGSGGYGGGPSGGGNSGGLDDSDIPF